MTNNIIDKLKINGVTYNIGSGNINVDQVINDTTKNSINPVSTKAVEDRLMDIERNSENFKSITYDELKILRNTSKLVIGKMYRIIDFVTTTKQKDTISAGNRFDILVMAVGVNILSQNASALQHDGDEYFNGVDIGSWVLKYDLDNDTDKYRWADKENGKGVIFYMKDDHQNEAPYDFKNIKFKRSKVTSCNDCPELVYSESNNRYYGMIDHLNRVIPSGSTVDFNSYKYCYTFNGYNKTKGVDYDMSTKPLKFSEEKLNAINHSGWVNTIDKCTSNIIKPSYDQRYGSHGVCYYGCMRLPDSVFQGVSEEDSKTSIIYGNEIGYDSKFNTFGNCLSNSLGNYSDGNCFGDWCYDNVLGHGTKYNRIGGGCLKNVFLINCYDNTFQYGCCSNVFYSSCHDIMLGSGSSFNHMYDECEHITFKNDCKNNQLYMHCKNIQFGSNIILSKIENGCSEIYIGIDNNYGKYKYVTIGDCNHNLTIKTKEPENVWAENITIEKGYCVDGSKTITIPKRGYMTHYVYRNNRQLVES